MQYSSFKISLVLCIIVLFAGTSFLPGISGNIRKINNEESTLEISNNLIVLNSKTPVNSMDVDWWPMFHHDLYNSGYSTSDAPDTNSVKWSYYIGDSVASPAVVDGKVYVGSNNNKVFCLDADTGSKIWNYSTDNGVYISTPAVSNGKVFINVADEVLCLNADTGSKIWSFTSGGGWSSPAVVDGKVYVGSNNNKVYCLNADTGSKIWNYTTGNSVKSSPAVANDRVYIGSSDNKVYCLDADTGSQIWNYTTGALIESSPAVVNGKVYIGSSDKYVYCLDADTGDKIWDYSPCCVHFSSSAIAYGKVYIGSVCDGSVYCFDADTGEKKWCFATDNLIWSSPAVADGKVYIGSNDYKMYCLFAETGNKIWSYTTGNAVITSPAVADENVYISSSDGFVYCFGIAYLPPVSDFYWTPEYPDPGETITFDASSSFDPDGNIVLYEWDWDSDGIYDESHTTPTATHIWYEEDGYQATLKVTDNDGLNDTCTKIVYVGNLPPTASFIWSPIYPESGQIVTFDASDSYDPNGIIVLYEWDWDSDGVYDESKTTPITTHSWNQPGSYTVTLKVTDDDNTNDTFTNIVYVDNIPPVADFSWTPKNPLSGEIINFDASDSYDTDGTIVLYEWDWDNDGIYDESYTTPLATHSWFQPGSYPVVLRVTDDDGADNKQTKTVNVVNRPPVAKFEWIPTLLLTGETATFDASASYDSDGNIVLYEWDWDNDSIYDESNTSPTTTKTWNEAGNYSVTLRVKDNNDATDKKTETVCVIANAPPDTPEIFGPTNGKISVQYNYTFITTDPDGDNVSYWIDWGDNYNTDWIGPYNSSEEITLSHRWSKRGTYTIKAKAKDIYDVESEWATFKVIMPRNKVLYNTILMELSEQFPNVFQILRYLL
jgi:outer membrane protein assembly factor BamB